MAIVFLLVLVVMLLMLRQNLIVVLGVAAGYCYLVFQTGGSAVFGLDPDLGRLRYVILDAWNAAQQEVLLSIPLFILAGNIMARGSIAARLIDIMRVLTAPVPGGLSIAIVLSCAIFAAISGSALVTLIAVGGIMYPALIREGYDKRFALGSLCSAGTLGIIIPPSIPLILYGLMTQSNVADLFKAGFGPALVLTLLFSGYALFQNWHRPRDRLELGALIHALRRGILALFMPVLILGGIYSGRFTATESAAVAVFYAVVVELFIHREMGRKELVAVTLETGKMLGSLFPVIMMALSLNTFLAYEQVPQAMVEGLSDFITSPLTFWIMAMAVLIVVGLFMDIGAAILIMAPLLVPIATSFGIDPVHFGIVMIVNLSIGYLTPPMGMSIIVAMGAFREPFWTICRAVAPFLLLMLVGLIIVIAVPELSLFMVR